jgi:16S rRNA (guanine966-N2)-methyltransferase
MRVIGGTARGRALVAPKGSQLRPTSDRVREAVFDVLTSLGAIEEAEVLDLFAGTGALGIEALSRGARHVTFVERERRHVEAIRDNLQRTGLASSSYRVVTSDVARFLTASPPDADVTFADPPYAFAEWPQLLELLPGELVVLESNAPIELTAAHELHRVYRYGGTLVTVARRAERSRGRSGRGGGAFA